MVTIRGRLLASTFICGAAALTLGAAAPAFAQSGTTAAPMQPQDQPAPEPGVVQPNADDQQVDADLEEEPGVDGEASEVEAVIVTGSRIRRDPTNAPTPLIQLNREEIIQSGEANIVDYLADVPALQLSQVPEDTTGNSLGIGGLSLLNLRGLGSQRTLVLVDGRRHVPGSPGTSSVDVDTIPSLLIESTEVITGAASAQYGADAVSGVVNFILRRNFEGIEVDTVLAQVNQDGQLNKRVSALAGRNFLGDRLNVYGFAEWQDIEEVLDADIDFFRRGRAFFQNDLDPSGQNPDGVVDVRLVEGAANLPFALGGSFTLARNVQPSPTSDPDFANQQCPAVAATCFAIDPGFTFVFGGPAGTPRGANFGIDRAGAGINRNNVVGSPDALPFTAFQDARTPEQKAVRFQTGANFDLTENVQLFAEYKHVEEETTFGFQPLFFQVQVRDLPANSPTPVGGFSFTLGLDNAFLNATPEGQALVAAVRNNLIQNYTAPTATTPGQPTTQTPIPIARFQKFEFELGTRGQINDRTTDRFVGGVRGELPQLFGFVNDLAWEIGYTWGVVEDENNEFGTVDYERYAFGADAVVDTAGVVNGQPGQVVCRVQLVVAQGGTVSNANTGDPYAATDPTIAGCVPFRIFGSGGVTDAARAYILTDQITTNRNEQQDVLAFTSGNLWDFWGAGPIGFAVGAEYREETASGTGSGDQNGDRVLFANAIADFPEASFDVSEFFAELRIPLLRDLPFAENLEVTLTGRRSDYSTLGESDTYGVGGQWRPSRDLLFRANYGRSVRAPNISELFQPLSQTFVNFVPDTCSRPAIDATADEQIRANRNQNCAALGVPVNYVDPNPASTNFGRFGGNTLLQPEESDSYTASVVLTPRFVPNFALVLDAFQITIEDAIATLTANQLLQQCTDLASPNPNACALITRDPTTFEITDFILGPLNFAALRTSGVDFNARYRVDLADLPLAPDMDLGRLDFSLRGTYLIRRQNFVNPTSPGLATNLDSTPGYPRVRFLFGTTWTWRDLALGWEVDHQTSQEIFDDVVLRNDPDNRAAELLDTGSFTQHDFTFRYDLTDQVRIRGGVVNAFDAEPSAQAELNAVNLDNFDLFGRRFFVGVTFRR